MANPLFNRLTGSFGSGMNKNPSGSQEAPEGGKFAQRSTFQDAMNQLKANPAEMIRQGGYKVPDDIAGNPQATVMHLIQSGQVGNPMMRMIMPMLNRMGVR